MLDQKSARPSDARAQVHKALLRAAEDLQTQLEEQGILHVVATRLAEIAAYDEGLSVYLLTPDERLLQPAYADGPFAVEVLADPPFSVEHGISGAVARTGQARIANDVMDSPDVLVIDGTPSDRQNVLAVPLRSRRRVLGVLMLYRSPEWLFSADDLDLVHLFANQAAIAIENARLLARERERANTLQELDRLRAEFVATVSHELRTPLTSIIGFTEHLQMYWGRLPEQKKRDMVGKVKLSSERLERLVSDLLVISRVEAGNIPLHIEAVEVGGLVAAALEEIEGKYKGEQHFVAEPPFEAVYTLADRDRLSQVLVNLLDNAVKYSPEGSTVTVRWAAVDQEVTIAVDDRGCGIAAADMPRLFTRFGKIGATVRGGYIGTGLGLFISRGLVEGMHGRIDVESVPGEGSSFRVHLPIAPD